MTPEKIGRYLILEPLGRGAIAEVYRALDPDLDREVAIKIIPSQVALGSAEVQQRFRREVQLAAHLNHPHIISVYDVGLDLEQPYLVTELLAGGTLADTFQKGPLSWDQAIALLQPICSALAYAHEAGIIHRDVKPANIMFTGDAQHTIKLVDFGLAYRQADDRLTQSGGITGTLAYMSPEQANGEAVDARTDIFALGLILFEAIAGYNPLRGETAGQTLLKAISYEPIDLTAIAGQVPDQVRDLFATALARDRRQRYASCQLMHQDMIRCLAEAPPVLEIVLEANANELLDEAEKVATVQIENAPGISLPPNGAEILSLLFAGYQRIAIKKELGGGFSGGQVLLVRPVRKKGVPELPAVIKMAPIRLIEQEWQAYQNTIKDQLSGVAELKGEPVFPSGSSWGGLRYRLAGGGAIEYESLHNAYRRATADDLRFILEERLFRRLAGLWRFNHPASEFFLAGSYDHLLPVNLTIQPAKVKTEATITVIRVGDISIPHLTIGDPVRLSGFVVTDLDEKDRAVTLDWPREEGWPVGAYRVRLKPVAELANMQVGQIVEGLVGVVTNTRAAMLLAEALETLGLDYDLGSPEVQLPSESALPNPLQQLPVVLKATPTVRLANIHGDLNPENILVDKITRDVRLIDFATARRDHVLHDFLRLEVGTITRLLPETLSAASLPPQIIVQLYRHVHCATFARPKGVSQKPSHLALEKPLEMLLVIRNIAQTYFFDPDDWSEYYLGLTLYLLGALKYTNLDQMAKKLAFYGAAAVLGLLEAPPPCQEKVVPAPKASTETPLEDSPRPERDLAAKAREESAASPIARPGRMRDRRARQWLSWLAANWLPVLLTAVLLVLLAYVAFQGLNPPEPTPTTLTILAGSNTPEVTVTSAPPTATARLTSTPTRLAVIAPSPTSSPTRTVPAGPVVQQKASIAILLDTSSSMNEQGKLSNAVDGVSGFIGRLDPDDELAVYKFGDGLLKLQPSRQVADVQDDLIQIVSGLFANGDTHLYDALCQAASDLAEQHTRNIEETRLYAIVLLTDGQDSGTGVIKTEEEALACLNEAREETPIQVVALAFGSDVDQDLLERLVEDSQGQILTTTPDNVWEQLMTLTFES